MKKENMLICGCKNAGCHFCGKTDEIWASMKWEDGEGGVACLHICGDCSEELISSKLTKKARKELEWTDEV